MKVGATFWFQNYEDLMERSYRDDFTGPMPVPDMQIYADELRLGELVEPLGFDSLWTIEHHFGPYGMTCNPLLLHSYFAGRTERIDFGSMVLVLPWHDPVRLAGEIAVVDHLIGDRRLMIGMGRGAAQREFSRFRVDYGDSRGRMEEALEIIRVGLTQEFFSYDGTHFKVPEGTSVRPRPRTTDLTQDMFLAWSSPETMEWAAHMGLGQIYATFADWPSLTTMSAQFNGIRAAHGWEPIPPVTACPVYCAETSEKAQAARRYAKEMFRTSVWHYDLLSTAFRSLVKGKEGAELERAIEDLSERSTSAGIFGTPEECLDQIEEISVSSGLAHLICQFRIGSMDPREAERSMRLFAAEVLPAAKALPAEEPKSTSFAEIQRGRPARAEVNPPPLEVIR
ncbi:MAG: LLM class flavin-dependent oxidoreductase [Acidimicrobiia bacterium]